MLVPLDPEKHTYMCIFAEKHCVVLFQHIQLYNKVILLSFIQLIFILFNNNMCSKLW